MSSCINENISLGFIENQLKKRDKINIAYTEMISIGASERTLDSISNKSMMTNIEAFLTIQFNSLLDIIKKDSNTSNTSNIVNTSNYSARLAALRKQRINNELRRIDSQSKPKNRANVSEESIDLKDINKLIKEYKKNYDPSILASIKKLLHVYKSKLTEEDKIKIISLIRLEQNDIRSVLKNKNSNRDPIHSLDQIIEILSRQSANTTVNEKSPALNRGFASFKVPTVAAKVKTRNNNFAKPKNMSGKNRLKLAKKEKIKLTLEGMKENGESQFRRIEKQYAIERNRKLGKIKSNDAEANSKILMMEKALYSPKKHGLARLSNNAIEKYQNEITKLKANKANKLSKKKEETKKIFENYEKKTGIAQHQQEKKLRNFETKLRSFESTNDKLAYINSLEINSQDKVDMLFSVVRKKILGHLQELSDESPEYVSRIIENIDPITSLKILKEFINSIGKNFKNPKNIIKIIKSIIEILKSLRVPEMKEETDKFIEFLESKLLAAKNKNKNEDTKKSSKKLFDVIIRNPATKQDSVVKAIFYSLFLFIKHSEIKDLFIRLIELCSIVTINKSGSVELQEYRIPFKIRLDLDLLKEEYFKLPGNFRELITRYESKIKAIEALNAIIEANSKVDIIFQSFELFIKKYYPQNYEKIFGIIFKLSQKQKVENTKTGKKVTEVLDETKLKKNIDAFLKIISDKRKEITESTEKNLESIDKIMRNQQIKTTEKYTEVMLGKLK